ncbi:MAG TPA: glycosyltransferase family 1 protein [Candidatus Magasanikbacteria bacterium]|nr:glycosyltransferase family 1 protein [Candidatus Magasanikbacteria bacterium]
MKILLVNKYWYLRGGAERVVLETKQLLEQAGHIVEIFGMNHPENIFSNKYFIDFIDYRKMTGWQKIKSAGKMIYNKKAKENFTQLVNDFEPDVVHFHNIYHQLSFSLLDIIKEKNIPSVMTLHDYKMISPNYSLFHHGKIADEICGCNYYRCVFNNCMEDYANSLIATIEAYWRKFKKYSSYIDLYISPSEFLKNKFVKCGWDEKKVVVINNPVSVSETEIQTGDYITFVGRLSKEKGVDVLLQAMALIPNIPLYIIGIGPAEEKLKKYVEENNLKNVKFCGFKSGQELTDLITKARLVVVPSIWYENYPMVVLEAKAMGKVVLASKIGGLIELLPEELLIDSQEPQTWAEAISLWYKKTDVDLIKHGEILKQETIKKNSFAVYQKSLLNIYEKIIKHV